MIFCVLIVVFAAHLWAMGLATCGPMFAVWLDWRGRRQDDSAAAFLGRRLAWWSVGAVGMGMLLGLVAWPLLRAAGDAERFLRVFESIPAARWRALVSELAFYLGAMSLYAAMWPRWRRARWMHAAIALVAGTTLAFHFPPLFTMLSMISTRAEFADATLDRALYWKLLLDGETLSRTAHHVLAGLALTGLVVVHWATRKPPAGEPQQRSRSAVLVSRVALAATLLQIPVGAWVLMEIPEAGRAALLGGEGWAMGVFVTGLVAAFVLMHHLAAMALGDVAPYRSKIALVMLFFTTAYMSAALHLARDAAYRQLDILERTHDTAFVQSRGCPARLAAL